MTSCTQESTKSEDGGLHRWEQPADDVQRVVVPGGWLYRTLAWVEMPSGIDEPNRGYMRWSDPVFVPTQGGYTNQEMGDIVAKMAAAAAAVPHP